MTTLNAPSPSISAFDPKAVRKLFPILSTTAHGKPLVYLDNGATTQKPQVVIDAIERYYASENANIHRGVYHLSQVATEKYEAARRSVSRFIHSPDEKCVLFTRGTTEGINLVASSWGGANLAAGDEVVVSTMEHHSNIVPWQMICQKTGATLRVIPITDSGELRIDELKKFLAGGKVRLVAVTHLSNSLGTINDIAQIARLAHEAGAKVLVDGAQWVAHHATDVQKLDCDFYCFSGHKLFGPTGIGVLYGKRELLDQMPPYQGGGDMIESVTFDKTTYAGLPNKFEAGTPNIAGAVGLGAAVDFVSAFGFASFEQHERDLLAYATQQLGEIPGLRIIGTAAQKGSVISFVLENPVISTLDVGTRLDREGIAVRTGHHCCQPVMDRMGIPATARASFALYNTREDVDALATALKKIVSEAADRKASVPAPASSPDQSPAIAFPKATAPSPSAAARQLAETFEIFDDRDERSQYVLDLGTKLPPTFDLLKGVVPRVTGCMSQVYLLGRPVAGKPDAMEFIADSDAAIVRGLIVVLEKIYSGQKATEVLSFDIETFFRQIGLDEFITTQRRNGLAGMILRIKASAEAILQGSKS